MKTVEVIVVGLGTVGSATCMELARRGVSVLGLDAWRPPHDMGSHHGESRSIRRAYLEGTAYVPMAQRAWTLWQKLERDTGSRLLTTTGNLTIGLPDSPAVKGFEESARSCGIPHEMLPAAEVRKRWPQLNPSDTLVAGLEKEAGILFAEQAITAFIAEAQKSGATLLFNQPAVSWSEEEGCVRVQTPQSQIEAGRLLLSAGAYLHGLLGKAGLPLASKRVPVHWVAPPGNRDYKLGTFPVNFWQIPVSDSDNSVGLREFYTLPLTRTGGRVKVAFHNGLADCDPATMARVVTATEVAEIRTYLGEYLPALAEGDIASHVCLYTQTPDGDFYLGPVPGQTHVLAVALAGHGFKFAPVLGEILADLLTGRQPAFEIDMFSPGRFL